MPDMPKIAIIYLCYKNLPHLPEVVLSWERLTYPKESMTIYIIPAGSPDGIADVVRRDVLPRSGKDLPNIVLWDDGKNDGFSANNNAPMRDAIGNGAEYIFLQNGDLRLAPDTITEAVAAAERDENVGSVQSLVMYWNDEKKVNTSGGMVHVAGFGFSRGNGEERGTRNEESSEEVAYASGAAVLYRTSALQNVGLLEEGFFMYHEDLELGLRLKIAGYKNVLAPKSIVYHDYTFGGNRKKFVWMETYRFVVLAAYLRVPTMLLLAPLWLAIELGSSAMMARSGNIGIKLSAYVMCCRPSTIALAWKLRRRAQKLRTISDGELTRLWTGRIEAQEMSNPFLERVVNPIVSSIWRILHRAIIW